MINKILVANRGEIALRVMRTAKEMGIKTVAVYSDADRNMPYVLFADEAVHIGPAPSSQSYLKIENILQAARQTNADAIHPGYGFLSEQAEFAKAVSDAGLTFIGPSAHSITIMGSKIGAKQAAQKFDVPMVPGTDQPLKDVEEAKKIANEIGFPILIKASAGGGGKGMRVVEKAEDFEEQIIRAKSEALNAFNNDDVFIEKYVASPKHIEIQILGDQHGNYVYLFERECSVQRRHQKLIEEAPSSCLTVDVRKKMGEAAVNVAKSCGYFGAGTVEFLVDEQLNFYFLEMNTRLQVEHCVTEMITGVDLVKEQIRIANGDNLSIRQEDLKINGHAIELRVCAEDPLDNFVPDTGKLTVYKRPQGPGVRVDDGYEEGMDIPIFYDPMISKLIVHHSTREEAIERLVRAVDEYKISGIKNTLAFGKWAVKQDAFYKGNYDTAFIQKYFQPEALTNITSNEKEAVVVLATYLWEKEKNQKLSNNSVQLSNNSNWKLKR